VPDKDICYQSLALEIVLEVFAPLVYGLGARGLFIYGCFLCLAGNLGYFLGVLEDMIHHKLFEFVEEDIFFCSGALSLELI
jgi:hypothetical protein